MSSSNETQISTVLLEYSLEEIKQTFDNHHLLALELDENIRRQYDETREALREACSVNDALKALKEETAGLKINLEGCQCECRDLDEMIKTIGEENEELERLYKQEQMAVDIDITEYKEKMCEIFEKFRQFADVYDEDKMTLRTEEASKVLLNLLAETERLEEENNQLKNTLENMDPEIPENILEIVGKTELEKKLVDLQKLHAVLRNAKQ
ncbi:uncharacterized protein LOC123879997 isoform X1 [Maniola jurtina]|uniref:uncharacterized protein LOC123879997 isoform X1 n=1 Tax=Maniola jurtina TaxID=191418 RepID=UPI001E68CA28|nr:uncharacterized protein LOC123879997 isoform X1 [Maniola jurtina]